MRPFVRGQGGGRWLLARLPADCRACSGVAITNRVTITAAPPPRHQVRRLHFHDFMLDIHSRLRTTSGEADPLRHVADDVAAGVKVGVRVCCAERVVGPVSE
jgi:hypothetical protein